jgi:hypothetical protein
MDPGLERRGHIPDKRLQLALPFALYAFKDKYFGSKDKRRGYKSTVHVPDSPIPSIIGFLSVSPPHHVDKLISPVNVVHEAGSTLVITLVPLT